MKYNSGLETEVYLDENNNIQVSMVIPSYTSITVPLDELCDIVNDAKNYVKQSGTEKYNISSIVIDPRKIEKDSSFCGIFKLKSVDICIVKYILSGRGCNFDLPHSTTFDNIKCYLASNGGEAIYVTECE